MPENAIPERESVDDDERLEKYKADITTDADATDDQRELANEDMRFINVAGGMWEDFLTKDFTAERVKMEFDLVSNYLEKFLGKWARERVAVEFKPDDSETSDDDAELLNGIYRADFRAFGGMIATDNAVQEAATCGYGAMKLATCFEDEEDAENDLQRIEWRPIYSAYNTVFWDESAQDINKRDARHCTVLKPFTKDAFEAQYPDESAVSAYKPNGRDLNDGSTTTPDFVYVATRYEVVEVKEFKYVYRDLENQTISAYTEEDHELIKDELAKQEFTEFVRKRPIKRRKIEKSIFSGDTFFESPKTIPGKWIPIIPFYGFRSHVDGAEWSRGLVRKLKDAARLYNVQVSQLAENAAGSGQEVPIFMRDQMENPDIQNLWANKNNKSYLVVDPAVDADGNMIAQGPIAYSKPAQLDGSASALLQIVPQYVNDTTGGVPQETLNPDMSGKAIRALMEIADLTTARVSKNISDAIMHSGDVYQGMSPEVYTTQRMLRTIGKDGKEASTQLIKTVQDGDTGKFVEANNLHGKKFRAYSDPGPSYDTLREQTVEDLKGMLEALKDVEGGQRYTSALISVMLANITGVGLDPIKELNRRFMLTEGLVKPENEEEEAMLKQIQEQKQQPDPQELVTQAIAAQQQAEARSLEAASVQKLADAKLKEAKTIETMTNLPLEGQKLGIAGRKQLSDERRESLKVVESLPLGG